MRVNPIILAAICLGVPHLAKADITVQEYQSSIQNPAEASVTQILIQGIMLGFVTMNAENQVFGNRPIFCQPSNLSLTGDQETQILNQWLEEHHPPANDPVDFYFLAALVKAFPCN